MTPLSNWPLPAAATAYLLGGTGNVAFLLHSGGQYGLAFFRFLFGAVLAGTLLGGLTISRRRKTRTNQTPTSTRIRWVLLWAACEAASIVLYMLAATRVGVIGVTAATIIAVPLIALGGRRIGLKRGTRSAAAYAALAVLGAGAITLKLPATPDTPDADPIGLLQLLGWLTLFITGTLVNGKIGNGAPALLMVMWACVAGTTGLALLALLTRENILEQAPQSTLWAALYIAILPGGLGKGLVVWATGRIPPYLVTATSGLSLISAGIGAALLLHEQLTPWTVLLMSTIVVSVALMSLSLHRAETATP